MKKHCTLLAFLALAALAGGCAEASKSADPLSPTIAGPIPGVNITPPRPIEPNGASVAVDRQPVTLVVENATSNSPRPLDYLFEVATDSGFANKVFSRESITPGDGRTSLRLPDALPTGRTYYWRARAQDGANTSAYSDAAFFNVFTPIVVGRPVLLSPVNNDTAASNLPTFVIGNVTRSGPIAGIRYTIELSRSEAFADLAKEIWTVDEQGGQTSLASPAGLNWATQYFWRARAQDLGSNSVGDWSVTQVFRTAAPPAPPSGGGGGGSQGPIDGNWENCGSTPGQALVECVHAAVKPAHTEEGAFEVTKRVAWLLRGGGAGLLIKNGGENIISWQGKSFSISRICYPDGHIYKVITDAGNGGANGPGWADNDFVSPSLYNPAIRP